MNRFDCGITSLTRLTADIAALRSADTGKLSNLPPPYFGFQGIPNLPDLYKLDRPTFIDNIFTHGLRRGQFSTGLVPLFKIRQQLAPVMTYQRWMKTELDLLPEVFQNTFGFTKPDHVVGEEVFHDMMLGNSNLLFTNEQVGKDELIRHLIKYIQDLLCNITEEYVPKIERKYF